MESLENKENISECRTKGEKRREQINKTGRKYQIHPGDLTSEYKTRKKKEREKITKELIPQNFPDFKDVTSLKVSLNK